MQPATAAPVGVVDSEAVGSQHTAPAYGLGGYLHAPPARAIDYATVAPARIDQLATVARTVTTPDEAGWPKARPCRCGVGNTLHDSGGWFCDRCCDRHHGGLEE